jgi:hypothetical protein
MAIQKVMQQSFALRMVCIRLYMSFQIGMVAGFAQIAKTVNGRILFTSTKRFSIS